MRSLLSAGRLRMENVDSRKLICVVLPAIALILLSIIFGPGARHAEAQMAAGDYVPDARKLHHKLVSTNTDYEVPKVDPSSP